MKWHERMVWIWTVKDGSEKDRMFLQWLAGNGGVLDGVIQTICHKNHNT